MTFEVKTKNRWQKDSRRMGLQKDSKRIHPIDGKRIAEGQIFLKEILLEDNKILFSGIIFLNNFFFIKYEMTYKIT